MVLFFLSFFIHLVQKIVNLIRSRSMYFLSNISRVSSEKYILLGNFGNKRKTNKKCTRYMQNKDKPSIGANMSTSNNDSLHTLLGHKIDNKVY